MKFQISDRMQYFAPGIFAELAELRCAAVAEGRRVIDLSIGSPDMPPPEHVRRAVAAQAMAPDSYVYSLGDRPALRQAAKGWYQSRFGVSLDAERELLSLYGAEDGLVHFLMAFVNPGDKVLVPDPYFPAVMAGVHMAGGQAVFMPLREENGFLIDFSAISAEDAACAKVMVVSYPNNPTTAVAPDSFYAELIAFARRHSIIVLHDNAYSDIVFDGPPGKSFLAFDGAMDVGVEICSLSKTYSMPGARLALLAGNPDIVGAFARFRSNIDLGSFLPTQYGAIAALTGEQSYVTALRALYKCRRDALVDALSGSGLAPLPCRGTVFVFAKLPSRWSDDGAFVRALFRETGVLLAPGSAFGSGGRGYVRFSLMCEAETLCEAARAIRESGLLRG